MNIQMNMQSLILISIAFLSLAFSITAFIIQIARWIKTRKRKQAQASIIPREQSNYINNYHNQSPQMPHNNNISEEDQLNLTVYMFPNETERAGAPQYQPQLNVDTYQVMIYETTPAGSRSYVITVMGDFTIGRMENCNLILVDPTISRIQCTLKSRADSLYISNNSSANITQLNHVNIIGTVLVKPGDILNLGSVSLTLSTIEKLSV